MILLHEVTKKYGKVIAVQNFSYCLNDGEITLLLGKNGAGKTTSINCILNLHDFDGLIEIDGISNKNSVIKSHIGYAPENPVPFDYLTVWEHMEYVAKSHNISDWSQSAFDILKRYGLDTFKDKLGKELSHGMKQKLNIATALLYSPRNYVFDEPMVGLDPQAICILKEDIISMRDRQFCVFISTHMIDIFDDMWDRAIIVDRGNVIQDVYRNSITEDLTSLFVKSVK